MKWFREGLSPFQTALAMIGARAGDRVLVLGAGDGGLAAELARVTGLNGRTLVIDSGDGAGARVAAAAARAGALVEFDAAPETMLPIDTGAFDIVVLHRVLAARPDDRGQILREGARVLRPAGRLIAIEGRRRAGLFGLWPARGAPPMAPAAVREIVEAAVGKARVLAETDAGAFIEAIRRRA